VIDQAQKLREIFRDGAAHAPSVEPPSVAEAGTRTGAASGCRSIAVTSGKGGVGKSNICLSLGIMLSLLKKKVLILDADLGLANIHILLGVSPSRTLYHYVNKECSLRDVVSAGPAGLSIIPAASGLEAVADLEPLQLGIFIREMSRLEQDYDFLLIDTGAGIGRVATEFASCADIALLVVTPEPTSLADAYAMAKVLYKKKSTLLYVVVNMAATDKEGKETFDRLNALVVKFLNKPLRLLGIIPFDKQVGRFVRRHASLALNNPRSAFGSRIAQCARALNGGPVKKKENFFSRFLALRGSAS
jgi:flagellar biosynthesis protein FlhG